MWCCWEALPFVHPPTCASLRRSIRPSTFLPVNILGAPVRLSVCPSVRPPTCPSVLSPVHRQGAPAARRVCWLLVLLWAAAGTLHTLQGEDEAGERSLLLPLNDRWSVLADSQSQLQPVSCRQCLLWLISLTAGLCYSWCYGRSLLWPRYSPSLLQLVLTITSVFNNVPHNW